MKATKANANQEAFLAQICPLDFIILKQTAKHSTTASESVGLTRMILLTDSACFRLRVRTVTRHLSRVTATMHRTAIQLPQLYRRLPTISPKPHRSYVRNLRPSISMNALDFNDGPLVWVDCEMTGLNPRKDKILEIAVGCHSQFFVSQSHKLENRSSSPMEISTLLMTASNM